MINENSTFNVSNKSFECKSFSKHFTSNKKKDQHVASATSFTGRFNIYDLILDKSYFEKTTDAGDGTALPQQMTKEDMTLIKVYRNSFLFRSLNLKNIKD